MATPKMKTITRKDWDKKHKDFKLIGKDKKPYIMVYDNGTKLVPVKIIEGDIDEGIASSIDLIRQDSKDVRDFVKKVFSNSDFRDLKNDKDFVKYLKSIYEGVSVNEGRSINAISKLQQKNIDDIAKALDFYKKNKDTDKKEAFIKVLKKLGDEKKKLAKELDDKVGGMYKDAEYKGESVVTEAGDTKATLTKRRVTLVKSNERFGNLESNPNRRKKISVNNAEIKSIDSKLKSLSKNESVVTEAKEDDVITQLRKIVKDKQNALVVDTKSKKKVRVDMQSASLMVQVYDALKQQSNKDKFVKSGIVAMGHMAYKLMKNEGVNEGDGLWANIRAKKARGEKPAHKNSKAHKDAVKAGNKINKDESVNEAKAFVVMFKVKKNINNKSIKPTSAAYSSEADAKKFLKSVEKDGGNGMIVRSNTSGMKTEANDADTYFKSATQAVEFAKKAVEKKGFTIDEDDWQTQIALGGRYSRLRPSVGKTHSFSVGLIKNGKPQRKGLSISLFGMDSGKFELTHYIN